MNQQQRFFRATGLLALLALLLGAGLLCGVSSRAAADDTAKPANSSAAPAHAPDYVIGADDVILIADIGHQEISQTVTVLSDGTIHVHGIDEDIKAAGLTLPQLKDRINKGLDRLYNNLDITVALKESHSRMVTLVGGQKSGQFALRSGWRISDLIAAAGGPPDKPQLVTATLIRGTQAISIDISKIIGPPPDIAADLVLQPDDELVLDKLEEPPMPTYSILGAVSKPGAYPLPKDGSAITLARAIADAGGQTDKAALTQAILQRGDQKTTVNLYPLLIEGKTDAPEARMEVRDGDIINIPESQARYMVFGKVNRPGAFPLPEVRQVDVLQALAEAGGQNNEADLHKAVLMRTVQGKSTIIKINLQAMITRADLAKNYRMQDNDVLFIPSRSRPFNIIDILSPLTYLAYIGLRPF